MTGDVRPFGELFFEPTRNGLTRPKAVRGVGVKMVNMGELFAYPRLRNSPMDRVPLSASEAERFLLNEGDLLFARQSLVLEGAGKCSLFLKDDEPVTFESHVIRVRLDPRKADPRFYFYYLQSPHGRAAIRSIVEQGAGASGIRGSDLAALEVQWRPAGEQRAIAHILGILDDKIELNRKMNETLEAMANAIFKKWFVKPVENGTMERWQLVTLGDLVEFQQDRVTPTSSKNREKYIALEDIPSKSIDLSRHQMGSAVNSSIISFRKGDILFGSMRPYFHKVGLAFFDGITRTTTFVLRPKTDRLRHFALFHFFSDEVIEFATIASVGSTIPYVKWDALRSYEISIPPDSQLDEFERIASALTKRISANGEESLMLATIRDALLPKLMSGEMRVSWFKT